MKRKIETRTIKKIEEKQRRREERGAKEEKGRIRKERGVGEIIREEIEKGKEELGKRREGKQRNEGRWKKMRGK